MASNDSYLPRMTSDCLPHQRELESWTKLNTVIYHGSKEARQAILQHEWWFEDDATGGRSKKGAQLHKFNVLLTTYVASDDLR